MTGGPRDGQGVALLSEWPPAHYCWHVPVWELPRDTRGIPGTALEDVYWIDGNVGGTVIYRYMGRREEHIP